MEEKMEKRAVSYVSDQIVIYFSALPSNDNGPLGYILRPTTQPRHFLYKSGSITHSCVEPSDKDIIVLYTSKSKPDKELAQPRHLVDMSDPISNGAKSFLIGASSPCTCQNPELVRLRHQLETSASNTRFLGEMIAS